MTDQIKAMCECCGTNEGIYQASCVGCCWLHDIVGARYCSVCLKLDSDEMIKAIRARRAAKTKAPDPLPEVLPAGTKYDCMGDIWELLEPSARLRISPGAYQLSRRRRLGVEGIVEGDGPGVYPGLPSRAIDWPSYYAALEAKPAVKVEGAPISFESMSVSFGDVTAKQMPDDAPGFRVANPKPIEIAPMGITFGALLSPSDAKKIGEIVRAELNKQLDTRLREPRFEFEFTIDIAGGTLSGKPKPAKCEGKDCRAELLGKRAGQMFCGDCAARLVGGFSATPLDQRINEAQHDTKPETPHPWDAWSTAGAES
jgi:hypothetical protein